MDIYKRSQVQKDGVPLFARSNLVELDDRGEMASSPGQGAELRSTINAGDQVTVAASPPNAAPMKGTASTSTKRSKASQPSLFATDHIPTLYHRIQRISKLLIQASKDENSLTIPATSTSLDSTDPQKKSDGEKMKEIASIGPDVTMGAMTEDDLTSGYEAVLAFSMDSADREGQESTKRTDLAHCIIRESQALRDAFQRAQSAIDEMQGGEMDIEEQEALLKLLHHYNDDQNRISYAFAGNAKGDVTMEED